MLGLCLYVPVSNSDPVEVEYFESNGLPSELKSLFNKLSVFLPSQEFSTYQKWRKVGQINSLFSLSSTETIWKQILNHLNFIYIYLEIFYFIVGSFSAGGSVGRTVEKTG